MARGALGALAVGALLGGVGVLCGQWGGESPYLCVVLQSMFSAMVFGITTFAQRQALTLDVQSLKTCPETDRNRMRGTWSPCPLRITVQPGL